MTEKELKEALLKAIANSQKEAQSGFSSNAGFHPSTESPTGSAQGGADINPSQSMSALISAGFPDLKLLEGALNNGPFGNYGAAVNNQRRKMATNRALEQIQMQRQLQTEGLQEKLSEAKQQREQASKKRSSSGGVKRGLGDFQAAMKGANLQALQEQILMDTKLKMLKKFLGMKGLEGLGLGSSRSDVSEQLVNNAGRYEPREVKSTTTQTPGLVELLQSLGGLF